MHRPVSTAETRLTQAVQSCADTTMYNMSQQLDLTTSKQCCLCDVVRMRSQPACRAVTRLKVQQLTEDKRILLPSIAVLSVPQDQLSQPGAAAVMSSAAAEAPAAATAAGCTSC
jgi:hypothetical protein